MTNSSSTVGVGNRPLLNVRILALACVMVALASAAAEAKVTVFRERLPTTAESSQDWEGRTLPESVKSRLAPVKLERFATPAGEKPTFSGKLICVNPADGAELGIVSMVGVHWLRNENYEWTGLGADGSFKVTAERNPMAKHAIAVKATGHPWTFLRAEFAPNESAKDIELVVPEPKTVRITAESSDGQPVPWFKIEIFNAFKMIDDHSKELGRQRYGYVMARGGELITDLAEPVGILISGGGVAPAYEILDPAEADEFHFIMLRESMLTGTVTRAGKPVAGERIVIVNEAAPLSATAKKTDNAGRFTATNRTPGETTIYVGLGAPETKKFVTLAEGEQTDVKIELPEATTTSTPKAAGE
jgi:hypothetical protein